MKNEESQLRWAIVELFDYIGANSTDKQVDAVQFQLSNILLIESTVNKE